MFRRVEKGFTLIELLIAVAVIGILAAVAVPSYRDYSTRSKVSELIAAAGLLKSCVVENVNAAGVSNVADVTADAVSVCSMGARGKIGASLVAGGAGSFVVIGNSAASQIGQSVQVSFVPSGGGNTPILWKCTVEPTNIAPAECR